MKKVILGLVLVAFVGTINAQNDGNQTAEGSWLIEANTNFGSVLSHAANTGFSFVAIDGNTNYNIGLEGGYFVADDLALKAGLGYGGGDGSLSTFSYKVGAKYYVSGMIPFQVDLAGVSIEDAEENPFWLGLQGGYAIFLGQNVSIEPGLRYNISLNDDVTDQGVFELKVGFALHF